MPLHRAILDCLVFSPQEGDIAAGYGSGCEAVADGGALAQGIAIMSHCPPLSKLTGVHPAAMPSINVPGSVS